MTFNLDKKNNDRIFVFNFSESKKIEFIRPITIWFIYSLFMLMLDIKENFEMPWEFYLPNLFWLPGAIVHFSYWFKNRDATVTIDAFEKTIEYKQNKRYIKFNQTDISFCEMNETRSFVAGWRNYKYLWFVLKDKRQIIVTNFITEPENIIKPLKLKCDVEKRTIPFLPIWTNYYDI